MASMLTGAMMYAVLLGMINSMMQSMDRSGSLYVERMQMWKVGRTGGRCRGGGEADGCGGSGAGVGWQARECLGCRQQAREGCSACFTGRWVVHGESAVMANGSKQFSQPRKPRLLSRPQTPFTYPYPSGSLLRLARPVPACPVLRRSTGGRGACPPACASASSTRSTRSTAGARSSTRTRCCAT